MKETDAIFGNLQQVHQRAAVSETTLRTSIDAKAPVNHVNNLGWTALLEAIALGDGGERHQATVDALIKGEADLDLPDRNGVRPLTLARQKGHAKIAEMLEQAGAKP